MPEYKRFLALFVWGPFFLTFFLSLLPDPLFVLNMSPDFTLEPRLIIIPNFYRTLWFGLNPFWFYYLIAVSIYLTWEIRKNEQ